MIADLRARIHASRLWIWAIVAVVFLGAIVFGLRNSRLPLFLSIAGTGALVLLQQPFLGLVAIVVLALVVPMEIGTGTEVTLNPVTLLVPALLAVWILDLMRRREIRFVPSRTNRPLLLFLLAGLLSIVIGLGTWDPAVPRAANFAMVQLAQWAIFAFAAIAFWLTGNLVQDIAWLRRLAFFFLGLAGGLALLRVIPVSGTLLGSVATLAVDRAPFWTLLSAMAGGQLLFNRQLSRGWQVFLGATLAAAGLYVFYWQRPTVSNWVGFVAVVGTLAWLRWPRLRWPVILLLAALAVSGVLSSAVYEFAGGEAEWLESGGSRMVLIGRVIEVTMRNPITGLGPAAYRLYAGMKPLPYGATYYIAPQINAHNNYVDLFAHVGLLGLVLFFWFAVELTRLGHRLRVHFTRGFVAGYVSGMLAAGAGALVLMMFADWILPFVYNIGFAGFQASVLVWLFLGGLVALEQVMNRQLAQ
jgi:hypothetical protein